LIAGVRKSNVVSREQDGAITKRNCTNTMIESIRRKEKSGSTSSERVLLGKNIQNTKDTGNSEEEDKQHQKEWWLIDEGEWR
jgi:hypothetical protein